MKTGLENRKQYEGYVTGALQTTKGESVPFETLVSVGVKAEGEVMEYLPSMREAFESYTKTLAAYLEGKPGNVYWRQLPTLVRDELTGGYSVWSRLVVSTFDPKDIIRSKS